MATRRGTARRRVKAKRLGDPAAIVAGFLLALEEVISGAPASQRDCLRLHAAHGLRRGSEKYRLDLISDGAAGAALGDDLEEAADEVRRTYLAAACAATQPEGEA